MARMKSAEGQQRGRRLRFHELSHENDIRYRGPLSYREFMILGWLGIICGRIVTVQNLMFRFNSDLIPVLQSQHAVLDGISSLSLAFLLIGNFAKILNNEKGYLKQIVVYGGAMLGLFVASVLLYQRYFLDMIRRLALEPENVGPFIRNLFNTFQPNGFVDFNIFVDLFLCTLFMFFLNYHPSRVFTGKKVIFFRLLAILPVGWELFSMLLKVMEAHGDLEMPFTLFPLLTVKPPMTFLVFMVLAFFVKTREYRFCRRGRHTHEEYQQFLKTNRNSLHFSVFLAVCLIVAALLDALVLIVYSLFGTAIDASKTAVDSEELLMPLMEYNMSVGSAVGFGETVPLAILAPLVLLFSYTRTRKDEVIGRWLIAPVDTLIPVIAIIIIVFVYVEGIHQTILVSHLPRFDLTEAARTMQETMSELIMPE